VHKEVDIETTLYIFVLAHEIKLSHHQVQSSEPRRRKKKRISLLIAMIKQPLANVLYIRLKFGLNGKIIIMPWRNKI
jgi:hypothetical protein